MLSEREHRLRLIRDDITAADRTRAERRRQADARQRKAEEQARQAEEARLAEEARRRAAPTRSTYEVAAAFDDWQRRKLRGGSLATQRF